MKLLNIQLNKLARQLNISIRMIGRIERVSFWLIKIEKAKILIMLLHLQFRHKLQELDLIVSCKRQRKRKVVADFFNFFN
jgi:hypothetical protein